MNRSPCGPRYVLCLKPDIPWCEPDPDGPAADRNHVSGIGIVDGLVAALSRQEAGMISVTRAG